MKSKEFSLIILVLFCSQTVLPAGAAAQNLIPGHQAPVQVMQMIPSHGSPAALQRFPELVPSHTPRPMSISLWKRAKMAINQGSFISAKKKMPEDTSADPRNESTSKPRRRSSGNMGPTPDGYSHGDSPSGSRDSGGYDWDNGSSGGGSIPQGVFSENVGSEISRLLASLSGAEQQALIGKIFWITVAGVAVVVLCTGPGELMAVAGSLTLVIR